MTDCLRWLCLGLRRNKGGPDQSWWSWHCFQATCWDKVTWVCGTHSSFALQKIYYYHLIAFNSNAAILLCSKELSLSNRDLQLKFILRTNTKIIKLNQASYRYSLCLLCLSNWVGSMEKPIYYVILRLLLACMKRRAAKHVSVWGHPLCTPNCTERFVGWRSPVTPVLPT